MSLTSRLKTWWHAAAREAEINAQVDEELRFHIDSYAEDLIRSGVEPDEAKRRARLELGSALTTRENCRQAWGSRWWDELRLDLRYALRMLARSPGFTAIAVSSLALGIGMNTVIFSAAQHMLLDRLAVPHPEQLRLFAWTEPKDGVVENMWGEFDTLGEGGERSTSFSYPVYQQLRSENRVLADVFAFKPFGRMTVTINGRAESADTEMVSGNYYSTLGVLPQLGRVIQDSDDREEGSGPVVMISDRFWTRAYGRTADVIGRTLLVNSTPMTIIGVNQPKFTGAYSAQNSPDIFLPFSMQAVVAPQTFDPDDPRSLLQNKKMWWVLVMGRVKPGNADPTTAAALNVHFNAAVHATMSVKKDSQIPRLQLEDGGRGQNPNSDEFQKPMIVLMGLGGFVLLLACANLANLLLARAGARQREISVRMALGAERGRIVRQMMTESMLLSVMGGAAGLLLAWATRNMIPSLLSQAWNSPAFSARFSWQIFTFAAAVSLLTGLIFGLAPTWQATRTQVSSGLKDSGQTVTRRRRGLAGKAIVVTQVALSMLLVVGAGLFVQTLVRLGHTPTGFRSHNMLLFGVELPETRYPGATSIPLMRQVEQKLGAVPGAESATLIAIPLLSGNAMNGTFVPEGTHPTPEQRTSVLVNDVGQDFFRTFQIPILAGRGFTGDDSETSTRVAVVSESLVKKYFPNVNPIGRTFYAGWNHPTKMEIIGVCANAKYYTLRKDAEPTYYALYTQKANGISRATFAVATRMDAQSMAPSIRAAVASLDLNLPLLDVRTQDQQIRANQSRERIFASLTACFGILALVLACIGIYGIMAYAVSQRTNEIGIRMALGAHPKRVLRMILSEASRLAAIGIAVGLCAALAMGRIIASLLYGLKFSDATTLGVAAALLAAIALAAAWVPARRAAGVDPMQALRHE